MTTAPKQHRSAVRPKDPAVCSELDCWCWKERTERLNARIDRQEDSRVVMKGVRVWGEGYEVSLLVIEPEEHIPNFGPSQDVGPRLCVEALNDGTCIDLLDLLAWVREHRPDLLIPPTREDEPC